MQSSYNIALKAVLKHEGGFVNNPKDPGGATNFGITQRVYDAYRDSLGKNRQSVRGITAQEVELIYRLQYWNLVKGDELPAGLDYCVFDFAVNSGPYRAITCLQSALGVKADGQIGMVTISAARTCDVGKVIDRICDGRLAFMKRIKHPTTRAYLWKTFGKGWQARVDGVRDLSKRITPVVPVAAPATQLVAEPMTEKPEIIAENVGVPAEAAVVKWTLFGWLRSLFG